MAGRARVRRPEVTPAPGMYKVDTAALTPASPRYTFGQRLDGRRASSAPGERLVGRGRGAVWGREGTGLQMIDVFW